MKKEIAKYVKLFIGLLASSLGIVIILKSNLGLSPWDVLNQGLNKTLGITLGQANLLVGFFIMIVSIVFKQPIGSGTVFNFLFIGIFIDMFMFLNFISEPNSLVYRIILLILGIVVFGFGGFLYMAQGIGCGPRDGMMVVLTKKTKFKFWQIKVFIEIVVICVGIYLGGKFGIGTIVSSFFVGPAIEVFFKVNKIDIKKLQHRSLLY